MGYIPDISRWQDPLCINYDVFCPQLDMAIIRVQYGSRRIDEDFKTHIQEMKEHGVPAGAYAWVRGISVADMQQEARDFYNRAKDQDPAFYALDVEEKSMDDMRTGISAYIAELRKYTDKKIGVYIAHHLYAGFNLDMSKADFVWIPHYGKNNGQVTSTPAFPCDLHQYTSVGKLAGYGGNLDLNRLMNGRTVEFFIGSKPAPVKPTTTVTAPKYGIITASLLNVRAGTGTGTGNKIIGTLEKGEKVKIAKEVNGWYSIYYGDHGGYISKQYVQAAVEPKPQLAPIPKSGIVSASLLNVRDGAGTGHKVIGTLKKGTAIKIAGQSGNWYSIYFGNHGGYVCKDYIK